MTESPDTPPPRRSRLPRAPKARAATLGGRVVRTPLFYRLSANLFRGLMGLTRRAGRPRALKWALRVVHRIGPLTREHRIAAANIAAAFPEKSAAERQAILYGVWDNIARVMVEFVFLKELSDGVDLEHPERAEITVDGIDRFLALRDDGKPGIVFSAHLANWEILGVVARKFGLPMVLPFRAPGNFHLAEDVLAQREALMGTLVENSRGATFEIAAALDRGEHLGMMVDQRLAAGIDVPFFGRPALTNPLIAKFARQYGCPVHGARAKRMPDGRLHLELTPPLDLPRGADGEIDIAASMAVINGVVEAWVREHPEQWFWVHNRWRH